MTLPEEGVLLRVFVGETDQYERKPVLGNAYSQPRRRKKTYIPRDISAMSPSAKG